MRQLLPGFCLIVLSLTSNANQPQTMVEQAEVTSAKAAIKVFAGALQTELKTAMQAGGPVSAIAVCNTSAMPITAKISSEEDMALSRVSLKNRNPLNAPNDWQLAVLQSFEMQKAAGADIKTLSWSETVRGEDGREFRFMKAIPTGGVCLACHGTMISGDVSRKLAEVYPGDKATGFSEGDIRGAFVVTRKVPD